MNRIHCTLMLQVVIPKRVEIESLSIPKYQRPPTSSPHPLPSNHSNRQYYLHQQPHKQTSPTTTPACIRICTSPALPRKKHNKHHHETRASPCTAVCTAPDPSLAHARTPIPHNTATNHEPLTPHAFRGYYLPAPSTHLSRRPPVVPVAVLVLITRIELV